MRRVSSFDIFARKTLQRREQGEFIAARAGQASREEGHHRRAAHPGKARGRGQGGRGYAEEGHKHAVVAAEILIGGVPHRPVPVQACQQSAQVIARNGLFEAPAARSPLQRLDDRILVGAVEHMEGRMQRQQPAANLQGGEMGAQQDGAPTPSQGGLEMLEPGDRHQFSEPAFGPPPAERRFDQRDAERGEVGIQQSLALVSESAGKHRLRLVRAMRRRSLARAG